MLVLALDTAVERASVVLCEDDHELSAWREVTHRDLCRRLASEVESVLRGAGREFESVALVAVGLGPGHFTGLRVGLATAKGLALARNLPLVGVSSLAAMAWQMRGSLSGVVCPMLDARRDEVYAGFYRATRDRVEVLEPDFVASPAELAERLLSRGEGVTLFGQLDRVPAAEIACALGPRARLWCDEIILPDALGVAQLARRRFPKRGGDDIASLRPIYVRMSYAEERRDLDLGLR